MNLLVEELYSELSQNFTSDNRIVISNIRLWLYKHLSPAGNIFVELVQDGATVATSTSITSAYLEANTDATAINYFHGQTRFDFSTPFVLNRGEFTLKLNSSAYSFSEAAYFGWVKHHENKTLGQNYTPNTGANNPFACEFWIYKDRL